MRSSHGAIGELGLLQKRVALASSEIFAGAIDSMQLHADLRRRGRGFGMPLTAASGRTRELRPSVSWLPDV
jgi:hypothetical protein